MESESQEVFNGLDGSNEDENFKENKNFASDVENIRNEEIDENFAKNDGNLPNFAQKKQKKFNFKLFLSILYLTIIVGAVVAITTFTLVLQGQTKNFNFNFNSPDYIIIHTEDRTSSANNQIFVAGSEEYEKIMELYNQSFEVSMLDAVSQGNANSSVTPHEDFKIISESSMSGTYIEFHYNEIQDIYLNGEKYEAKSIGDESYNTIVIEVQNSDKLTQVSAYFKYRVNYSNEYSYVSLSSFAVQNSLYDYINNL